MTLLKNYIFQNYIDTIQTEYINCEPQLILQILSLFLKNIIISYVILLIHEIKWFRRV